MLCTNNRWTLAPHLRLLTERLMDVATGKTQRLIVSMPPGHGKSTLVSHYFPTWMLGRFPDLSILLTSYEANFAAGWGRQCRDTLAMYGPQVFGVQPDPRVSRADWWQIQGSNGKLLTAGMGGAITGKRFDVMVVDDPVKNSDQAGSSTLRAKQWDWFASTAYTRLEPGGRMVVVMTRWHEDDLAGRLIAEARDGGEPWEIINLPALAGDDDPLDRKPGAALWPERYSADALERTRGVVGSFWFNAMYQGRPTAPGGEVLKSDWFRYWRWADPGETTIELRGGGLALDVPADSGLVFQTIDLAASLKSSADYSVIQTWMRIAAEKSYHFLMLDQVRRRMDGPDLIAAVEAGVAKWKPRIVGVESSGFQLAICQMLKKKGIPVREIRPDRDKLSRALAATPAMESGRVWFPAAAPWRAAREAELLAFPNAAHDDQVDALSMAIGGFVRLPSSTFTAAPVTISSLPVHRRASRILDIAKPSDYGGQPSTIKESDGGVYLEED